jgi:PAS domain S-box-containing protein
VNKSVRILLVEDNPGDALLIRRMLAENHGSADLEHVTTLAACLERLQQQTYDAVLLDLGLPDSNGMVTFDKLIEYTKSVPVIILTGLDDGETARKAVGDGAQDFLAKNNLNSTLLYNSIIYSIERNKLLCDRLAAENRLRARTEELHVHQVELELQNDELRRLQAKLEASRKRYFDLYDLAPVGYFTISEQGLILEANLTAAMLLGMTRNALVKRPFSSFIHPDDQDIYYWHRKQLFASGEPQSCELRLIPRDGGLIWVRMAATAALDDADASVCRAVVVDITQRKQGEESLRESEQEFRSLAEAMPQIVWVTRPDGWNIYFNHQWVEYTGLTLEESYGHGWNTPFHPDDRQRAWDAWQNATKNEATYSLECRLRRADGTYQWWLIRGVPLRDADGKILKWFGTCTDIEHIKQVEVRIASQLEELRRWQNVMLDREDRVRELKREVNEFCRRVGEAPRYPSQEDTVAEPGEAPTKQEYKR